MELYSIEEAQRQLRNCIVKNDFTEEEAGRCIAVVSGDGTNSASKFFFEQCLCGCEA